MGRKGPSRTAIGTATMRAAHYLLDAESTRMAAPGSEIVFQFIVPAATLAGEDRALVEALAVLAAGVGEPWLSTFAPNEMETHIKQMGFRSIRQFGPEQASDRYLHGRTDGLRLPSYFHMISAVID
jgi:O-methyltransferase involved in polyketide biosynthesis